jgi:peptidoglycan/xylan/chitin deacetylase (PgdA/CDA1 family)
MTSVPILMYHSVSEIRGGELGKYTVTPGAFEAHLALLADDGYATYTVSDLLRAIDTGTLADRPVAVTFDDGLADFHERALPLLQRYGVASTLYVPTAGIGGRVEWLGTDAADNRPMLTADQLRDVHARGVEVGAHSHTHPELDMLGPTDMAAEVRRPREVLEDLLSAPVSSFAYPFGYHRRPVRDAVREAGYASACAVGHLGATEPLDRYAIPRLIVLDTTSPSDLKVLLERGWSGLDRALVRAKDLTWRSVRRARRLLPHSPQ